MDIRHCYIPKLPGIINPDTGDTSAGTQIYMYIHSHVHRNFAYVFIHLLVYVDRYINICLVTYIVTYPNYRVLLIRI
jgi:hypothetical protein